jgi:hypothetical protein
VHGTSCLIPASCPRLGERKGTEHRTSDLAPVCPPWTSTMGNGWALCALLGCCLARLFRVWMWGKDVRRDKRRKRTESSPPCANCTGNPFTFGRSGQAS